MFQAYLGIPTTCRQSVKSFQSKKNPGRYSWMFSPQIKAFQTLKAISTCVDLLASTFMYIFATQTLSTGGPCIARSVCNRLAGRPGPVFRVIGKRRS